VEEFVMRRGLLATAFVMLAPAAVTAAEPEEPNLKLHSERLVPGLPLAESARGVYGIRLTARVDLKGEGRGTLELDPTVPTYDDFGFMTNHAESPPVTLVCTLKFVKREKVTLFRVSGDVDVEWQLFEIRGPKITSRLFLATQVGARLFGRLVVRGGAGP
jgi:hypothetical protein